MRTNTDQSRADYIVKAASAAILRGKGGAYIKESEKYPEFQSLYENESLLTQDEKDEYIGGILSDEVGGGNTYDLIGSVVEELPVPEEEKEVWRGKRESCKTEVGARSVLGAVFRQKVDLAYEVHEKKQAEVKKALEELTNQQVEHFAAVVAGKEQIKPDVYKRLTEVGGGEMLMAKIRQARKFLYWLQDTARGEHTGVFEEKVREEARRRMEEGQIYIKGITEPLTQEEMEQQVRSEWAEGFDFSREEMQEGVKHLLDSQGKIDRGVLGLAVLGASDDAKGMQSIHSKFWSRVGEGIVDSFEESGELFVRYFSDDYTDETNTVAGLVKMLERERLSPSEKGHFLAQALTNLGTQVGENAPALAVSLLPGGAYAAGALFTTREINSSVDEAYFEGVKNPELYGWVTGGFSGGAEMLGAGTLRKTPLIGQLIDKGIDAAKKKMLNLPLIYNTIEKIKGNKMLDFGYNIAGESFMELVGEEVVSQTGSKLMLSTLRGCGVEVNNIEWKPFEDSWEGIKDLSQSSATVAYVAAVGLLGKGVNDETAYKTLQKIKKVKLGFSWEKAEEIDKRGEEASAQITSLAEKAKNEAKLAGTEKERTEIINKGLEEIRGVQSAYITYCREQYIDLITNNPEQFKKNLEAEHKASLSELEARILHEEGVLEEGLKAQGVSTERNPDGTIRVRMVDEEKLEADKAKWENGEKPQGFEEPVKEVVWSAEQYEIFARFLLHEEDVKRMKRIRSRALAIDMAEHINTGEYAKALPLTESAAPVAAALNKAKGSITLDVLKALSKAAAVEGENGVEVLPGVSNRIVWNVERSAKERAKWAQRQGDKKSATKFLRGELGMGAMRLPSGDKVANRIVYTEGRTTSVALVEDVLESVLYSKLVKEGGVDINGKINEAGQEWLNKLWGEMRELDTKVRAMQKSTIKKGVFKGLEGEATLMNVVEGLSHFAQSAYYQNADEGVMDERTRMHVAFMDRALTNVRYLEMLKGGYNEWIKSEEGQAWVSNGGGLADLLKEGGHEVSRLYEQSRVNKENVRAVMEAQAMVNEYNGQSVDSILERMGVKELKKKKEEGGEVKAEPRQVDDGEPKEEEDKGGVVEEGVSGQEESEQKEESAQAEGREQEQEEEKDLSDDEKDLARAQAEADEKGVGLWDVYVADCVRGHIYDFEKCKEVGVMWEEVTQFRAFKGFGVDDLDYLIAGGKQVLENIFSGKYSNWIKLAMGEWGEYADGVPAERMRRLIVRYAVRARDGVAPENVIKDPITEEEIEIVPEEVEMAVEEEVAEMQEAIKGEGEGNRDEEIAKRGDDEVNDNVTVEQEEEYLRRASVALTGRLDEGEGMDGERFALPLTGVYPILRNTVNALEKLQANGLEELQGVNRRGLYEKAIGVMKVYKEVMWNKKVYGHLLRTREKEGVWYLTHFVGKLEYLSEHSAKFVGEAMKGDKALCDFLFKNLGGVIETETRDWGEEVDEKASAIDIQRVVTSIETYKVLSGEAESDEWLEVALMANEIIRKKGVSREGYIIDFAEWHKALSDVLAWLGEMQSELESGASEKLKAEGIEEKWQYENAAAFVGEVTKALDKREILGELLAIIKTDGRKGLMRLMKQRAMQRDSIRERVMNGGKPCLMKTAITAGEVVVAMKRRSVKPGQGWKTSKKKEISKEEEAKLVNKALQITVGDDPTRPYLSVQHERVQGGKLWRFSTDGRRAGVLISRAPEGMQEGYASKGAPHIANVIPQRRAEYRKIWSMDGLSFLKEIKTRKSDPKTGVNGEMMIVEMNGELVRYAAKYMVDMYKQIESLKSLGFPKEVSVEGWEEYDHNPLILRASWDNYEYIHILMSYRGGLTYGLDELYGGILVNKMADPEYYSTVDTQYSETIRDLRNRGIGFYSRDILNKGGDASDGKEFVLCYEHEPVYNNYGTATRAVTMLSNASLFKKNELRRILNKSLDELVELIKEKQKEPGLNTIIMSGNKPVKTYEEWKAQYAKKEKTKQEEAKAEAIEKSEDEKRIDIIKKRSGLSEQNARIVYESLSDAITEGDYTPIYDSIRTRSNKGSRCCFELLTGVKVGDDPEAAMRKAFGEKWNEWQAEQERKREEREAVREVERVVDYVSKTELYMQGDKEHSCGVVKDVIDRMVNSGRGVLNEEGMGLFKDNEGDKVPFKRGMLVLSRKSRSRAVLSGFDYNGPCVQQVSYGNGVKFWVVAEVVTETYMKSGVGEKGKKVSYQWLNIWGKFGQEVKEYYDMVMAKRAEETGSASDYGEQESDKEGGEQKDESVEVEEVSEENVVGVVNEEGEVEGTQAEEQGKGESDEKETRPGNKAKTELQDSGRKIWAKKDDYQAGAVVQYTAQLPEDYRVSTLNVATYMPKLNYKKLAESGMDRNTITLLAYLTETLGAKPRGEEWTSKARYWKEQFEKRRGLCAGLLEGSIKPEDVINVFKVAAEESEKGWSSNINTKDKNAAANLALWYAIGYPECLDLKKAKIQGAYGSFWDYRKGSQTGWHLTSDEKKTYSKEERGAYESATNNAVDSLEKMVEQAKRFLEAWRLVNVGSKGQGVGVGGEEVLSKKICLLRDLDEKYKVVGYYVGAVTGAHTYLRLSDNVETKEEGFAYMRGHVKELNEKFKRLRKMPGVKAKVSGKRIGKNWRGEEAVTTEQFMKDFGISGVVYGNWVNVVQRQAKLNATYDAFKDLAALLGIPDKAISLHGELGIMFGANGEGGSGAAAHYEPGSVAINLTRDHGDGSLAHEWMHALDNYFMRQVGYAIAYSSESRELKGMNDEARAAFVELMQEIHGSKFRERSVEADRTNSKKIKTASMDKGYYGTRVEMLARCFEGYVLWKLEQRGERNDYLVSFGKATDFDANDAEFMSANKGASRYPYPTKGEMEESFGPLFDKFFKALTHREDANGQVVTFNLEDDGMSGEMVGVRISKENVVMDIDKMAGILKSKQGIVVYNEKLDIKARMSGQTKGKSGHARMSVANLKPFGISSEEARVIHYTAAARIDELFKKAEYGFFEYSYKGDTSRKGAYHAFTTIEIEGYGVFDVNISAVQPIQLKDGSFLFTLEATIENPSHNSALLPSSLRGAAGNATGITERNLSAYRSFVEKEMMYIKKNAEEAGVFMKAPNGENSQLSERLWCVVRTSAFKAWFGDWENDPENASKIIDGNGEPMVVYHGTERRKLINIFKGGKSGYLGPGIYFTPDEYTASKYTGDYGDGKIYQCFINMRNPLRISYSDRPAKVILDMFSKNAYEKRTMQQGNESKLLKKSDLAKLHKKGYDGIAWLPKGAYDSGAYTSGEMLLLNPNQIKSATDNRGTFDVGSDDITMSLEIWDEEHEEQVKVRERKLFTLLNDIRRESKRFERVFELDEAEKRIRAKAKPSEKEKVRESREKRMRTTQAIEAMGSALAIMSSVNKYVEGKHRPKLRKWVKLVEVYARMLEKGRIANTSGLEKEDMERIREEYMELLREENVTSSQWLDGKSQEEYWREAEKEERESVTRMLGARKLPELLKAMLKEAEEALVEQEKVKEIGKMEAMLEGVLEIRIGKSGKPLRGVTGIETYRELEEIRGMMGVSGEEAEARKESARGEVYDANDDERDEDMREHKVKLWHVFGAIKEKSLEEVRVAADELESIVLQGKCSWLEKQEEERQRVQRYINKAVEKLGGFDANKMAEKQAALKRMTGKLGVISNAAKSFGQELYMLSGAEGLRELAEESLKQFARGNIRLTMEEEGVYRELEVWFRETLGIKDQFGRAKWLEELKKVKKITLPLKVKTSGELVLSIEEAEEWVKLTEEERDKERARRREEAENNKSVAENIPEEEDMEEIMRQLNNISEGETRAKYVRIDKTHTQEIGEEMKISKDELLNIWLTYQQPWYAENAEWNGYTEDVLEQIRGILGEEVIAYGEKLRSLLKGEELAREFERREGIPFANHELYWPGHFENPSRSDALMDALMNNTAGLPSTKYSFLIRRLKHKEAPKHNMGATNAFFAAKAQTNSYIIMGELTAMWRRILRNKDFVGGLTGVIGSGGVSTIRSMIDLVDNAHNLDAIASRMTASVTGVVHNAYARSVLSLATTTTIKQTSALVHAKSMMKITEFVPELLTWFMRRNKAISWKGIRELDGIRGARVANKGVDRELYVQPRGGTSGGYFGGLNQAGMNLLAWVDRLANAASMMMLYNWTYRKKKKENPELSDAELREICEDTVNVSLELVGQPQRLEQKSMLAALGANDTFTKTSMYMNGEIINKLGFGLAMLQKKRLEGATWRGILGMMGWLSTLGLSHQLAVELINILRGDSEDETSEEFWANIVVSLTGVSVLQSLPIMGGLIKEVLDEVKVGVLGGKREFYQQTASLGELIYDLDAFTKLWGHLFGEREKFNWTKEGVGLMRSGAVVAEFFKYTPWHGMNKGATVLQGVVQDVNSVLNALRPYMARMDKEEKARKKRKKTQAAW